MNIRAKKAVIVATGGMTSNLNFRRMFDPRLTEVLTVAGEPYSLSRRQRRACRLGHRRVALGLGEPDVGERRQHSYANACSATKWNYMTWEFESPIFPLVRATG